VVTAADAELATLVVRYTPLRGSPAEIEDRIYIGRPGEVAAVYGVGRWLRILRAGRVHVSGDPYELCRDTDRALDLLRRCVGANVELSVVRRLERSITLWTDTGVERIGAVMDFVEGRTAGHPTAARRARICGAREFDPLRVSAARALGGDLRRPSAALQVKLPGDFTCMRDVGLV
jgi:hypothetical protein